MTEITQERIDRTLEIIAQEPNSQIINEFIVGELTCVLPRELTNVVNRYPSLKVMLNDSKPVTDPVNDLLVRPLTLYPPLMGLQKASRTKSFIDGLENIDLVRSYFPQISEYFSETNRVSELILEGSMHLAELVAKIPQAVFKISYDNNLSIQNTISRPALRKDVVLTLFPEKENAQEYLTKFLAIYNDIINQMRTVYHLIPKEGTVKLEKIKEASPQIGNIFTQSSRTIQAMPTTKAIEAMTDIMTEFFNGLLERSYADAA